MSDLKLYTVTIERSDRDQPDPIEIYARDRDDAIETIKRIYKRRCRKVVSARQAERPRTHDSAAALAA